MSPEVNRRTFVTGTMMASAAAASAAGSGVGRPLAQAAEFMKGVQKPWIAFKVMAAGAIPPQDAFRYAFQNGADFVLAGMSDFEIAEDTAIAKKVLAEVRARPRPWRG